MQSTVVVPVSQAGLVSSTSRELASGADIEFLDRGSRELKGISGARQLYEAQPTREAAPG